jgi:glycosyltransferase involved in cell wall biosynthesis
MPQILLPASADVPDTLSLTVIVPVYNERYLVAASLERLLVLRACPLLERVQVVVVDDGSKDGSDEIVAKFVAGRDDGNITWQFIRHERNQGKGAAVRTGLQAATGAITVIHDADLECEPADIPDLLPPFLLDEADAVYGSRFLTRSTHRVLFYRHELGNRLLTFLSNLASNYGFTDMETCYKVIRTDLWRSIPIESNDFRMEPEITIKLAKRGARVYEVPIRYAGRSYDDGKKISWKDGFRALVAIVTYAVTDNIYSDDGHASQILVRLARVRAYARWVAATIKPFVGDTVFEVGAGLGGVTASLLPRPRYLATDVNPLYVGQLQGMAVNRPYLAVSAADLTRPETLPAAETFDTVIALNVVDLLDDDHEAVRRLAAIAQPGGRLILMVPRGSSLLGSLDRSLNRRRRYSRAAVESLAQAAGLEVEQLIGFNRAGWLGWWCHSKLMRHDTIGIVAATGLSLLVPLVRAVEAWLPLPSLSWLLVSRKALPLDRFSP